MTTNINWRKLLSAYIEREKLARRRYTRALVNTLRHSGAFVADDLPCASMEMLHAAWLAGLGRRDRPLYLSAMLPEDLDAYKAGEA